ncbi:MAG: hypothetical protein LBS43_10855, partial [Prevotellaceae bacterium]|nr:hypothetical protein [Prevotellaceae bacterium]
MSNFITKKLALLCCIFFATAFIAEAQGLEAVNDIIRTGPLQTVRKDIIYNDIIPGDSYSWKITTTLPVSQGTITKNGDNIIFTPNAGIRDTDFFIEYELSGSGTTSVATVHIFITNYNMPVNIIDSDVECFSYMDENITFGIRHKYSTSPTGINSYVDGYQLPLVGDLNGDGKPEIVAMGATGGGATPGGSYDIATGYINIYDGQTGVRLVRYDYDPDMNLTGYHRPPAMLALADLDSDGLGEIVMCNSANGRVTAYKPVINSAGVITNLSEMWTARDQNNAIVNYKAPLPAAHNNFQHAMPNIADLDADGIPEVIVYNKIFQGTTGRLVMSWQGQNSTTSSLAGGLSDYSNAASLSTSAIANNYRNAAMVGKRLGSYAYTRFIPIPAITDIDGDGMQEIITGSYIYNFNITDKSNHTNNSYSISHGPLTATVHENNSNNNATVTYNFSDGFTRVADIDGDGSLDIIVLVFGDSGSADTKGVIYVWNTNDLDNVKACISFRGNGGTGANFSVPFIGDINGELDGYDGSGWTRKLPEICLVTGDVYINRSTANEGRTGVKFHPLTDENIRRGTASGSGTAAGWDNNQTGNTNRRFNRDVSGGKGHIIGLTWDASATVIEDRLKLSWGMEHDDDSGNTGITLFDFDNNNTADLCYRDEKTLRVISPAINGGKDYVELSETEATPGSSIMFRTNCATGTGYEAPVIADVNMDGSADIVVTNASSSAASRAWIDVFEYNGHKWSPCPPVWNQGMYDPTQVREDLKINAQPTPILTPYVKNGETIYPYNGSWMQRPIVRDDDDYVPVVRKPDAILMDMDVQVSSSTTITLDIYNKGTATIAASALIHFYNGGGTGSGLDLQNSPLITTQQVGVDIFPNERKILTYTLTANYNNTLIWATILMNNQGVLDAGYDDCDISNNFLGGAHCPQHIYTVTASPDTVICGNDNVVLTATPQFSANTPVYQWYRNDMKITGATSQTYTATLSGTYKCYVIDGICRDFSSPKTITRDTPVAVDDHVSTTSGVTVKVNVLHNDTKSEYCNPMPVITKYPNHASSSVDADGRIIYTSVAGYTGTDTLTYSIAGSEAKVYFKISNLPDNVIEADCEATPPATVWSIKEIPINTEAKLHNYGPLTVGDIDDDGTVEIIGFIEDGSSYAHDYTSTGIKIFYFDKDEQKVKLKKQFKFSNEHDITATFGGMAIARYNNQGYIVVAGIDYYLYAYSPDGSLHWKSDYQYHSLNNHYGTIVSIADFDGNGTPEVYTGNSIFSIANGHRICDGGASGNRGQLYKYSGSMSFAANIVGDNKLELCAGDTIYDVNLTNHTMTPVKSLTSALPTGAYHDGA